MLGRAWVSTPELVESTGKSRKQVRRRLARLEAARLVEHTVRGDGLGLWRLTERGAALQARAAKRSSTPERS